MKRRPALLAAAPIAAALALAGCVHGPDLAQPTAPAATRFTSAGDAPPPRDQAVTTDAPAPADWWTSLGNAALNTLIGQAMSQNQDIATAQARLDEAQAVVAAAQGARGPQASLGATAGRQKYGAALFGPLDISVPPFTYYTVGPSLTIPLDVAGGARHTVEMRAAQAKSRAAEVEATRITVAANIAAQALTLAAAQDQQATIEGIVAEDERNANLVQSSIRLGSGTRTQLLAAQSQTTSDRTLVPALRQQQAMARHALAILSGQPPGDWPGPAFALADFTLPDRVAVSVPSELVRRRPDILAAEARLDAARAEVGVATANLYPRIDITAAFSQQALTPEGLFNSGAGAWSIAGGLTQPLFNGGRLKAEQHAAVKRYDAALAAYRQTVLVAFGQVADALQAIANDADQFQAETEAANTAAASADIAQRSFKAGNSGVLDLIDAQRRLAQAQLGVARARARRLMDTVRLEVALAGAPGSAAPEPGRL
jgi:NodT family efflux transporter outer membrane factor (OMF) lipoprotein